MMGQSVRLILFMVVLWIGGVCAVSAKLSKVLFIDSYSRDYEKTNLEVDIIINQLLNDRVPIDFSVQYLSSEVFLDTMIWKDRMDMFLDQCRRDMPDAIVLVSDEAWTTFRSCDRSGLDSVPIVLSSCRSLSLPLGKMRQKEITLDDYVSTQLLMRSFNAVGELRELKPALLFDLIDRILPDRESYLIITDYQFLGRLNRLLIREFLLQHRKGVPVTYLDPNTITTDSLCRYLSGTNTRVGAFFSEWNDPLSQVSSRFTRTRLEECTKTPFFINSSEMFNSDAQIAGNYISKDKWGERSCQIISQVLFGVSPIDIPSEVVFPQQAFVNCDALSRFNLSLRNVPEGVILINEPPRFFTQYKNTTIVIVILGTLLLVIITILVAWNRKMHVMMVREKENLYEFEQKNDDLRLTQMQLVEALDRTKEIDKVKSSFLSNMSHEIRTPLNAIIGFSELLIDTEDSEEKKIYMDTILKNNALLLKLVNDVLDISRLDSGSVTFSESECSVFDLLCELHTNFEALVPPGISFRVKEPREDFIIKVDRSRLYQIVSNFVSNACKFTLRGHIELALDKNDHHLLISVEDTGIGIPEPKLKAIFTRFEKVNGYDQGVGLGLSLASSIADLMGGQIVVASKVLSGSKFTLQLPIACIVRVCTPQFSFQISSVDNLTQEKEDVEIVASPLIDEQPTVEDVPSEIEPSQIESAPMRKMRVLYAEDNDSNFLLVEKLLANRFDLTRACNGQEAVDRFVDGEFQIVLMDLLMPVLGGIEATKLIRSIDPVVPIIAVSASVFETDVQEALNAGCNAFLPKPVNIQRLLDTLKNIEEGQTRSIV